MIKTVFVFRIAICITFLLNCNWSQGQILPQYPKGQSPYQGGYEAYYKDFHEIVVAKDLKPCANPTEFYQFSLLVNADGSVNFIKDFNHKNSENNKCAYELARTVAREQKNWKPATIDSVPKAAIATFMVFPEDLFQNYVDGYFPAIVYPKYGKSASGDQEFRKGIVNRIDLRRFSWDDRFEIIVDFIISKDAKITDVVVIKSSSNEELDKRVVYGIRSSEKKWSAATVNGLPIDYKYRLHLSAVTDPL